MRVLRRTSFLLALCSLGAAFAAEDARQAYRFVVASHGKGEIEIRGIYSVDGRVVTVPRTRTPFEFSAVLGQDEFVRLGDDGARTAYLRRHVPANTIADPATREAVCTGLSPYAEELGIALEGCAHAVAGR